MSMSGAIGAILASVILFPAAKRRKSVPRLSDEEWLIARFVQRGVDQDEIARRLEVSVSYVQAEIIRLGVSRKPEPVEVAPELAEVEIVPTPVQPVSCETNVAEACRKLAGTSTGTGRKDQEECLEWIRQFHRKTGQLPSFTKVRTALKLSNGTAHRYRNKVKAEVEMELQAA